MPRSVLKYHQDGCLTDRDSLDSVEELEDERSLTESDRDWSNEGLVGWSDDEEEGDAAKHHKDERDSTDSDEMVLEIEDEVSMNSEHETTKISNHDQ